MPWKKNIRKVPTSIQRKLDEHKGKMLVAGCMKKIPKDNIEQGDYNHLGIRLSPEGLVFPKSIVPNSDQGKYSDRNIYGQEIKLDHLPKETHYNYIDAPNYGDPANGYHTVALPYKKYPRDFIPPRNSEILIECRDIDPNNHFFYMMFRVQEVLNPATEDFQDRVMFCLNLLQENIGTCGIEPVEANYDDYLRAFSVDWEILPPGSREEAAARVFRGRNPTAEEHDVFNTRYDFFVSLNPQNIVYGTSGFQRYYGAMINPNLVVFENVKYGNAVYVMFDNWERLSRLSRIELLSGRQGNSFERIPHVGDWQRRVKDVIRDKLR